MADAKPAKAPRLGEIARDDHGISMARAYTATMMDNPDSVLQTRGRDFTIYEEMLRDDQCKATLQQRRAAVTSCEWQVEPVSEAAQDVAIADFVTAQLKAINWDKITDKMLYGVYFGYAVAEVMWAREGNQVGFADIKVRNRDRFRYYTDNTLRLVTSD